MYSLRLNSKENMISVTKDHENKVTPLLFFWGEGSMMMHHFNCWRQQQTAILTFRRVKKEVLSLKPGRKVQNWCISTQTGLSYSMI